MSRRPWLLLVITLAACEKSGSEQPTAGLKPKNPAPPASDAAPVASRAPCPSVVVVVKPDGVWIRDPKTQSVIAPCGGELDGAALRDRLCAAARGSLPDCAAVEVAAEPGVRYQQLIAVMDAAIAVGLRDVGLTEPGSVSFPLRVPPDPGDKVPPACGEPVSACPSTPAAGATATGPTAPAPSQPNPPSAPSRPITIDIPLPPGPTAANSLVDAVVVVVPADGSVMVDGKKLATAAEASAGERIEPLYKALKAKLNPSEDRTLVLQVDQSVDARLVNRVVTTANAAGYQNIMFAVRRKP